MREQSKKVYEYMQSQKARLQEQLKDLQEQQKNIDERIADATIVLLGLERMIGTLEPEVVTALTKEVNDEFERAAVKLTAEQEVDLLNAEQENNLHELNVPEEFRRDEPNYGAAAE